MMNSQAVRFKQSKLEIRMNRLVFFIILAQIILCTVIAIVGSFWYRTEETKSYYLTFEYNVGTNGVITFFSYFLLVNTLLPISLIVTLEVVKVI
jgi:magnesium-transporting ATPase (P-type)